MPKTINPVYATVTTYRSFSTCSFFDLPTDATPQDCKEVTAKLLAHAAAVIVGIHCSSLDVCNSQDHALVAQIDLLHSLIFQAQKANELLDIEQAVLMAQREEV